MQIAQLPFIDEHAIDIAASADEVWAGLLDTIDRIRVELNRGLAVEGVVLQVAVGVEEHRHAPAAAATSIFWYRGRVGWSFVPGGTGRYAQPASATGTANARSSPRSAVENGRIGWSKVASALMTFRAVASVSAAWSRSVFTAFHGARASR